MDIAHSLLRQQLQIEKRLRSIRTRAAPLSHGYWMQAAETWTYASATTFTITDAGDDMGQDDFTAVYQPGDFIRLKQGGAFLYFMISAVAYADPTTTVTIDKQIAGGQVDLANAAITDNYYSKAWSPQGCGPTRFTPGKYTSTSWDGDAHNANETIDLSATFGVPAGVKAVVVRLAYEDETPQVTVMISKDSGDIGNGMSLINQVANYWLATVGIVPCDASGDIYWWQNGEIDSVSLTILGYWS